MADTGLRPFWDYYEICHWKSVDLKQIHYLVSKIMNRGSVGSPTPYAANSDEIRIPLSKAQREILSEFYQVSHTKVIFNKKARQDIWSNFITQKTIPELGLGDKCPALLAELEKSISSGNLVQSAVFSECVYAQTLANMLRLREFYEFSLSPDSLSASIVKLIASYGLKPRYVYKNHSGRRALVQAGGHGGVDSALITIADNNVFTIEFKEPGAKTSEPDLPTYGEDGFLRTTAEFKSDYPQFELMLKEQIEKRLNFFNVMGSNVNDFTVESVQMAVSENYAIKKYADVICVEDKSGYLTMLPANQVGKWANTRGEIRPAGRNHYKVFTPEFLKKSITDLGGTVHSDRFQVPYASLVGARKRGGTSEVNRLKLNPLLFVYAKDVTTSEGLATFAQSRVRQLRPTISAHMFFKELQVSNVHTYYESEFQLG